MSEQIVTGRLYEDEILLCFESRPNGLIHWRNQDNVYTYYKDSDHLENQDPRYTKRTLSHSEIHNGNASLSFRRFSLLDELSSVTPVMKYEKSNRNSFLMTLSVYPRLVGTWQVDNTPISESNMEETRSFDPFYNKGRVNITGSNLLYECVINPLLKQTTGRWTTEDCELKNVGSYFWIYITEYEHQDIMVTWSRVESGTSSFLACFLSSSRNTVISELQLSWNKEPINQSDFSLTLRDLSPSDNGEYLCNISSRKLTLFIFQTLLGPGFGELRLKEVGIEALLDAGKHSLTAPKNSPLDNYSASSALGVLGGTSHPKVKKMHHFIRATQTDDDSALIKPTVPCSSSLYHFARKIGAMASTVGSEQYFMDHRDVESFSLCD
ncbi:LOW QUALITY PROTEIN: HERV-H LTR-associating protein 2 [Molossus nigricans]